MQSLKFFMYLFFGTSKISSDKFYMSLNKFQILLIPQLWNIWLKPGMTFWG